MGEGGIYKTRPAEGRQENLIGLLTIRNSATRLSHAGVVCRIADERYL